MISKLVSHLAASFEIKLEAAYCLCHIAAHQQKPWAEAMLKEEALKNFIPLLKSHDGEAIHIALAYLEAMFKMLVSMVGITGDRYMCCIDILTHDSH